MSKNSKWGEIINVNVRFGIDNLEEIILNYFHDSDVNEKVTILLKYKSKVIAVCSYEEIIIEDKADHSYERELLVKIKKIRRASLFQKYIGDKELGACLYYACFGPYSTY